MWLYLLLLLGSVIVPITLSFDQKLRFSRHWQVVLPAIAVVAIFFIAFDILFTHLGVWGFNARYHLGIIALEMPFEEYLFFLLIPYACLFIHYAFFLYFPQIYPGHSLARAITFLLIAFSVIMVIFNLSKTYTVYAFSAMTVSLLLSLADRTNETAKLFVSFLIMLVPFVIVNGVLTGSLIDEVVVWYNPAENLGIRVLTIPVEDFAYGFSLVLFNVLLINFLNNKKPLYAH